MQASLSDCHCASLHSISFDSVPIKVTTPQFSYALLVKCLQKFIKRIESPDGSVNRLNISGDSILHSIVKMPYNSHRKKELKLRYLNGLLMHSDVDVNLPNAQKTTALHIAVEVQCRYIYIMCFQQ